MPFRCELVHFLEGLVDLGVLAVKADLLGVEWSTIHEAI
jgi:hypothetical protein